MTLQTLLNIASELGIRENLVNFCANGPSVYALNPEEIKNYPLFFLSPTDNTVVGKTQTRYGITVYYMDRLLEDSSNETQIDSVAIETLRNFLKQLENEDGIVEISEPSIRLFTSSEKMLDRVAGAYTTVNITTLNNTNCEVYLGSSHSSKNYDKEIQALSSVTNTHTEQIGLLSAQTAENLTKIGALSAITDSLDSKIVELSGQTSDNTSKIAQISALTEDCCTNVHRDIESLSAATETAVSGISSTLGEIGVEITALSGQVSGHSAQISSLEQEIQTISGGNRTIIIYMSEISAMTVEERAEAVTALVRKWEEKYLLILYDDRTGGAPNRIYYCVNSRSAIGPVTSLRFFSVAERWTDTIWLYTDGHLSQFLPIANDIYTFTSGLTKDQSGNVSVSSAITEGIAALSASTQSLETEVASKGNVASTSVNSIWTGTQAEYDAITEPSSDTLYFITD